MADCVKALKEWTGKASARVIFDTIVDEFTDQSLFDKVNAKIDIAIVGFTTDGDVFGGFYSRAVTKPDELFFDPNMFIFSFESNGRCLTPKRFVLKEGMKRYAFVTFYKNDSNGMFVSFCGNYWSLFSLGDDWSDFWSDRLSEAFEDMEDDTLTGDEYPERFTCVRLVAVQLE